MKAAGCLYTSLWHVRNNNVESNRKVKSRIPTPSLVNWMCEAPSNGLSLLRFYLAFYLANALAVNLAYIGSISGTVYDLPCGIFWLSLSGQSGPLQWELAVEVQSLGTKISRVPHDFLPSNFWNGKRGCGWQLEWQWHVVLDTANHHHHHQHQQTTLLLSLRWPRIVVSRATSRRQTLGINAVTLAVELGSEAELW